MFKSAALVLLALTGTAANAAVPGLACFEDAAATRNYSLGYAADAMPTPDGKAVIYLRSGARDIVQRLYEYTLATHQERELVTPEALLGGKAEQLSNEEKARRERARISVKGITAFHLSQDGTRVLVSQGGKLFIVERPSGKIVPLPGEDWTAPKFSPDGARVAAVRDDELHVIDIASAKDTQLTHGASATLLHGEAEFVAQEEMSRRDGFWWSPDSHSLAYEETDLSPVEVHYIADPGAPQVKPVEFRYPANANVRLGIISADGGPTVWVPWDTKTIPI